jgi:CSLREA domain-containing protein
MLTPHTPHFQLNSVISTSYTHNLVFIDTAVEDYQSLVNGVIPHTEVFIIDSTKNGVEQITEILATHADQNLTSIHIVCHGTPGSLQLGNAHLGLDTLEYHSQQLQQWQKIFSASDKTDKPLVTSATTSVANLLIYGCNVAAGDVGAEFIAKLHQLTGANIAASRHLIGNAAFGGNWELEVRTAQMEVSLAFSETTRKAYAGVLATFTVNDTQDADDGDANNGITTLREAIKLANAAAGDDTITFGGVFTDNTPDLITLTSGQLTITDDITILGTGASNLTVSGNNASRVFEISGLGRDVSIDGLKIANGNDSGILVNTNSLLSLTNSNISDNTTTSIGGGINNKGTLKLTNTSVSDNTANSGGGIYNLGILGLTKSSVSGNTATSDSGGIYNGGTLSLTKSSVSGNTATSIGGGIYSNNDFKLTNSTVSNNTANNGGGIYNGEQYAILRLGTATLSNSTVSGNKALEDGGGIYNFNELSLINSTITNNTADSNGDGVGNGGGVLSSESDTYSGGLTVVGNTIIAGNFDKSSSGNINPDVSGTTFRDSGNNLIGNQTGSTGFTTSTLVGTNASPIDPKLGLLQNNGGATLTHALLTGSPAINAGNNSLVATNVTTDQRGAGFNRIFNNTVDIGAYEVQSPITPLPVNTDTVVTNTNDSGAGSLRQALLNANATAGADTITFAGSVFTDATPDIITLTSGQLTISDDVTIVGIGASKLTVSGNNASSVLEITGTGTDVSIDGLKIANANDVIYGSILLDSNASLNLTNSIVSDNRGAVGGIFNRGNLSLINTTVSGNQGSSLGGGVFNTGTLSLTNSTVSGNSASLYRLFNAYGGGIFNTGTLKITGSTVSNNTAFARGVDYRFPDNFPSYGGGIYNSGTVDITGSTISGNGAQYGGGIFNDGTFSLTNSTVSDNRVYSAGSAIYNNIGTLTLTNDTIANNVEVDGIDSFRITKNGGVLNESGGTVVVGNTIIAGNLNNDFSGYSDVKGDFTDIGNNLIGDNTGSTGFTTSTLVGTSANPIDPKLSPLQNNGGVTFTNALLEDSPAINTGNNALIPAGITTDQRGDGFDRISEGTVDIGALEFNGVNGTNGADNLVGNNYGDIINAQAGNDTITGNQGNDILTGGGGKDKFVYNLGDGVDTITDFGGLGKGSNPSAALIGELDILKFQGAGLTARNLLLTQNVNNLEITFEGVADDKIILQNFPLENLDNLSSLGNILFDGESSIRDSFDVFNANSTQSTIFNKNTVTFLNDLNNNINGFDNLDDVINGQGGDDRIDGKSGNDILRGGGGNDTLIGGVGNDILVGGGGQNSLIGGVGDDTLVGGGGQNSLIGGAGNDILFTSDYGNTLTGGSGNDQFVYQTLGWYNNTITDFNQNEDKLVLTEAFKNLGYSGSNPILDGYLQFVQSGTSTQVNYSFSGIGSYFFTLATLNNFTATNLVVGSNVLV